MKILRFPFPSRIYTVPFIFDRFIQYFKLLIQMICVTVIELSLEIVDSNYSKNQEKQYRYDQHIHYFWNCCPQSLHCYLSKFMMHIIITIKPSFLLITLNGLRIRMRRNTLKKLRFTSLINNETTYDEIS
jgi:hypothetical protein